MISGDITQIDLPIGRMSGLVLAMKVVGAIDGISFVYFDDRDVVRHKLVQQIVKAYEAFSNGTSPGRPSTTPRPLESLGVGPSQVEGREPQARPEDARGTASSERADAIHVEPVEPRA